MPSADPPESKSSEPPGNSAGDETVAADGVSAFVARVLDQLSLSAWLPAALLVFSVAVLLQFRKLRSVSLLDAVDALTKDPLRALVIMIPLLVIATMVTQAFSFGAIRTLEGYWNRRGPASFMRTAMIRWHVRRRRVIEKRLRSAERKAFAIARPKLLLNTQSSTVVNALEADVHGVSRPVLTPEENIKVDNTDWRLPCPAWRLAYIDHMIRASNQYPDPSRILPTRLGNLLRSTEDRLVHAEGDIEGFALRRRELVPQRVQIHHDQFRNRLDMYCTLVFVSLLLAALAPALLIGRNIGVAPIAVMSAIFFSLGVTSYLAAIASANGYCAALVQMDRADRTS
jgi:hypothetical protein